MQIPKNPTIYEINTATFLYELSRKLNKKIELQNVPTSEWDKLQSFGVNAVWFMGIWNRSAISKRMSPENPDLIKTLPDLKDDDILGSAYSIQGYEVSENFGGRLGLVKAREQLEKRGIGVILDYVPNHVGLDHPWANNHHEYFVQGSEEDLQKHPKDFYSSSSGIIAKGKDPNYAPWSDVAQLNAFSDGLRYATTQTLINIAKQCDGVRCDMAMLMMNEVFYKTWGDRAGEVPKSDFWPNIIKEVKTASLHFSFIAEVYWYKQQDLLDQGFDYCYDKDFYDFITKGPHKNILSHLHKSEDYQNKLLKFIENHDEDRSADLLDPLPLRAAAVMCATFDGARLFHQGQFDGHKARIPVHLNRANIEVVDLSLKLFYAQLLHVTKYMQLNTGKFNLLNTSLGKNRSSHHAPLAWRWKTNSGFYIVAINYSAFTINSKISTGLIGLARSEIAFTSLAHERISQLQLRTGRIRLNLEPWGFKIIRYDK